MSGAAGMAADAKWQYATATHTHACMLSGDATATRRARARTAGRPRAAACDTAEQLLRTQRVRRGPWHELPHSSLTLLDGGTRALMFFGADTQVRKQPHWLGFDALPCVAQAAATLVWAGLRRGQVTRTPRVIPL